MADASSVDCDVVIVAHNSGRLLHDAVTSAVDQAGAERVWIMDAESTDGSVDALQQSGRGVHIVPVLNRGFAAANNRGIELTSSSFVMLLNPDAAMLPGALSSLLAAAEADPRVGIIGAKVLNLDGSVQAGSYGRFPSLAEALRLRFWKAVQRLRGNSSLSPEAPLSTTPVDWVTGAAMLARRAAVDDVGPMDEGFFLYYEDTDWCHRMRDHGWKVLLEPGASVVHHLGHSAAPEARIAEAYRASFYRYCDHYGLWGLKTLARVGLSFRRLFGGAA